MEFQLQQSPLLRSSKSTFASGVEFDWTPTVTFATPGNFSLTYVLREGRIIRIGSLVHAFIKITGTLTKGTASGIIKITGLPISVRLSADGTGAAAGGTFRWQTITKANYTQINASVTPVTGETCITMQASGSGQATSPISAADMTDGALEFIGFVTYLAADKV